MLWSGCHQKHFRTLVTRLRNLLEKIEHSLKSKNIETKCIYELIVSVDELPERLENYIV